MTPILIILLAIVTFLYAIYTRAYYKYRYMDMPPGPYGLPVFGYAPFLGGKSYETFKKLSLKYGSIFSLTILNEPVVVVNDRETIHEVLIAQGSTFSGRPYQFLIDFLLQRKEIVSGYGAVWKEHKRFLIKTMRDFGLGTSATEDLVFREVDDIIHKLEQENGKAVEIKPLFFIPILNCIWGVTAGKRFGVTEEETIRLKTALDYIISSIGTTSILNIMPFLRFILPNMTGYSKMRSETAVIFDFLRKEVDLHWNSLTDTSNDIIGHYIAEIRSKGVEKPPYDRESLVYAAYDFFDAASETLSSTLQWAFLCMALWPDVQQKVQQELDSVMGSDSHLSYSLKERVPYTLATLHEVNRFGSVAPLGMPHIPLKDTKIKGYLIKKGTMVITNLWSLHYDEETWGDPKNFRPERFLDKDGKVIKHDCLLPFSAGPRFCMGHSMAEYQLFLFFTSLIHHFSYETVPGSPKPTLEPVVGITLQPADYSLVIKLRK